MTRLSAILFLLILLFNLVGYRVVITGVQNRSEVVLQQQLDRQEYSDDELLSVKTILNLPYYTESSTFERAYGSITINGKEYEYVKRRVYRDTLELLCIPNHTKTKWQLVSNEFAKSAADAQTSAPSKKNNTTLKISLPDLFEPVTTFSLAHMIGSRNAYPSINILHIPCNWMQQPDRPPQAFQSFSC